jgi:hypothetical protein
MTVQLKSVRSRCFIIDCPAEISLGREIAHNAWYVNAGNDGFFIGGLAASCQMNHDPCHPEIINEDTTCRVAI